MIYKICFFDNCVLHYAYERFLCQKEYTYFNDVCIDRRKLSINHPHIEFFILEEKHEEI